MEVGQRDDATTGVRSGRRVSPKLALFRGILWRSSGAKMGEGAPTNYLLLGEWLPPEIIYRRTPDAVGRRFELNARKG